MKGLESEENQSQYDAGGTCSLGISSHLHSVQAGYLLLKAVMLHLAKTDGESGEFTCHCRH